VQILADDLTGACDAGAAFLAAGHAVRVWFGARALYPAAESVQSFYTASRHMAAGEAADAVARAVRDLRSSHAAAPASGFASPAGTLLFKKVDSAGRGPMGAELLAAHQAWGTQAILFAPAFPAMGRTVRAGVLEVRGASGEARHVHLADLFPIEMRGEIALIAHADELVSAFASGHSLLICDSSSENDLRALVRAAGSLPGLLYAGSAGLAGAWAALHPAEAVNSVKASAAASAEASAKVINRMDAGLDAGIGAPPTPSAARILVAEGSPHAVAQMQLAELESAGLPASRVRIFGEKERYSGEARDFTTLSAAESAAILAAARDRTLAAFEAFDPQALILIGGSTAQFTVGALGADSILLRGQLSLGIPWGILQGGSAHGRIAVTKSGGFGAISALRDLVETLLGEA
jgi:uncharacterized protein YgbK (DUF1537 family)